MKIGLVAEHRLEVREVSRKVNLKPLDAYDEVWGANLNNRHAIRLCLSGMAHAVTKLRVDQFLIKHKVDLLICSGLAGALRPDVNVGDIILQSADPLLLTMAESALERQEIPFHSGPRPLVTVRNLNLATPARRHLAQTSGALAMDVEGQAIAHLCREHGVPCLAMKAVSDGIDDDLTPVMRGLEPIHMRRLAIRVLARPDTWLPAARLAWHSYVAANQLGRAVWATIDQVC